MEATDIIIIMCNLMIAHFVGDFCFQNRWMAENKSLSVIPLSFHIIIYTSVLLTYSLVAFVLTGLATIPGLISLAAFNGVAHFAVDFATSKINKHLQDEQEVRLYWIVIGADQLLHGLILLMSIPIFLF